VHIDISTGIPRVFFFILPRSPPSNSSTSSSIDSLSFCHCLTCSIVGRAHELPASETRMNGLVDGPGSGLRTSSGWTNGYIGVLDSSTYRSNQPYANQIISRDTLSLPSNHTLFSAKALRSPASSKDRSWSPSIVFGISRWRLNRLRQRALRASQD
jgi:hypothetical protein